jgi:competence protein ComEC
LYNEEMKSPYVILAVLLGLNVFAWTAVSYFSEPDLKVIFFDVGQGDAIFIETPQRHQILIDGGPASAILKKLGEEMPFWDRTIDLVLLTHPDHDHIAGLLEVLERYKVKNILWTGVSADTAENEEWQNMIKEEKSNIYIARSGQQIKGGLALLTIFYPFESLEGKKGSNTNNTSVVARLTFGETSFLFTGDIYRSAERALLKEGVEIDSDILKVAHHGSKTSSDKEFISSVSPDVAVISCGKDNPYGHPHETTLDALGEAIIMRTDLIGDVKLITDGAEIRVLDQEKSGDESLPY